MPGVSNFDGQSTVDGRLCQGGTASQEVPSVFIDLRATSLVNVKVIKKLFCIRDSELLSCKIANRQLHVRWELLSGLKLHDKCITITLTTHSPKGSRCRELLDT